MPVADPHRVTGCHSLRNNASRPRPFHDPPRDDRRRNFQFLKYFSASSSDEVTRNVLLVAASVLVPAEHEHASCHPLPCSHSRPCSNCSPSLSSSPSFPPSITQLINHHQRIHNVTQIVSGSTIDTRRVVFASGFFFPSTTSRTL